MDDNAFPFGQLLNAGINGFVAMLIWNLIQQNKQLIAEMRERDSALVQLIYKLIDKRD
jgi:hypothetical protein